MIDDRKKRKLLVALVLLCLGCLGILTIYFLRENMFSGPSPKVEEQLFQLRLGHNLKTESAMHWAAQQFAEQIKEKTNGKVSITIYPDQQLGTDQEMLEMAMDGQLDIILTPTAKLSTYVPAMQFVDLPFLFPNREAAYEILDGEPGQLLLEKLDEYGLTGVAIWGNGFKQFTANKAIHAPHDFQELNIRVMKSRIIADQFQALGANPIPIDFHQTYQALKDGSVDGQENPLVAIVGMKFYEVQSHLTISNHAYLGYVLSFNKKILDSLPAEIKAVILATVSEITPLQRQKTHTMEDNFLNTVRESGCVVSTLTEAERSMFQKETAFIIDKYSDLIGPHIMAKAQDIIKKYAPPSYAEDDLVIGLTADLTMTAPDSGRAIKDGLEMAVAEINQLGGVLGKKIRTVVLDDGGMAPRSLANVEKMSKMSHLVALMCGKNSPSALVAIDLVHREKIPFLIPWAAATNIVDNGHQPNYVFRVSVRDEYAGIFLAQAALARSEKVALVLVDNQWGKSNEEAMVKALAAHGISPLQTQWVSQSDPSPIPQLAQISKSGAGVILLAGSPDASIAVFKGMADLGLDIPVVSHWGMVGGRFWQEVNSTLTKIPLEFIQTFSLNSTLNEHQKNILSRYQEEQNLSSLDGIKAPSAFAHAYDLTQLLAKAIGIAGSFDRSAIRDAFEKIDSYEGLVKTYSPPFTPLKHEGLSGDDYILCRFDSEGRIIPVGR